MRCGWCGRSVAEKGQSAPTQGSLRRSLSFSAPPPEAPHPCPSPAPSAPPTPGEGSRLERFCFSPSSPGEGGAEGAGEEGWGDEGLWAGELSGNDEPRSLPAPPPSASVPCALRCRRARTLFL